MLACDSLLDTSAPTSLTETSTIESKRHLGSINFTMIFLNFESYRVKHCVRGMNFQLYVSAAML